MLKQLIVVEKDRVGVIADVAGVLGSAGVNIASISAGAAGGKAVIRIALQEAVQAKAKQLLKRNGFRVVESEAVVIKFPDSPGELAKISRMLADEGVSVSNIYMVHQGRGEVIDAIQTSDDKKARKILHRYLVCN